MSKEQYVKSDLGGFRKCKVRLHAPQSLKSEAWKPLLLYVRVLGWSDLGLFSMFEIGHSAADQVYVYEFNTKNRQIWQRAAKFLF